CLFYYCADPCALHSFPTRRSSDLLPERKRDICRRTQVVLRGFRIRERDVSLVEHRFAHALRRQRNTNRAPAGWGSEIHLPSARRSEEHTSELQSRENLVCRLLLEK